ncbi:hypothetical protein DM77_3692 [Burkholderia mallei]|nr:hypothetical protein DM77_3692 [Burkholderia mallei]
MTRPTARGANGRPRRRPTTDDQRAADARALRMAAWAAAAANGIQSRCAAASQLMSTQSTCMPCTAGVAIDAVTHRCASLIDR